MPLFEFKHRTDRCKNAAEHQVNSIERMVSVHAALLTLVCVVGQHPLHASHPYVTGAVDVQACHRLQGSQCLAEQRQCGTIGPSGLCSRTAGQLRYTAYLATLYARPQDYRTLLDYPWHVRQPALETRVFYGPHLAPPPVMHQPAGPQAIPNTAGERPSAWQRRLHPARRAATSGNYRTSRAAR